MFEGISTFFKRVFKVGNSADETSKDTAKERLHLVLMQDRANVSADFLDLMKQEIIEVIKKYIDVDEKEIDVRLTNQPNDDGTTGAPALYANIPIINIKNDVKGEKIREQKEMEEKSKLADNKENEQEEKEEIEKDEEVEQEEKDKKQKKNKKHGKEENDEEDIKESEEDNEDVEEENSKDDDDESDE